MPGWRSLKVRNASKMFISIKRTGTDFLLIWSISFELADTRLIPSSPRGKQRIRDSSDSESLMEFFGFSDFSGFLEIFHSLISSSVFTLSNRHIPSLILQIWSVILAEYYWPYEWRKQRNLSSSAHLQGTLKYFWVWRRASHRNIDENIETFKLFYTCPLRVLLVKLEPSNHLISINHFILQRTDTPSRRKMT